MREERPSSAHVVSSISPIESRICHIGGVSAMMRTNMRIGVKNGNRDAQNASCELGCCNTGVAITIAKMMGNIAGHCTCWASWSEFTIEPSAAYMVEYMKYPRTK